MLLPTNRAAMVILCDADALIVNSKYRQTPSTEGWVHFLSD
jgi:hypothetical protein